jgi:ribonuclease P/MRP protein subunit POP5
MNEKKSRKAIPLSLRDRKRYLVFELISSEFLSVKAVNSAIKNLLPELFGSLGLGKMNFQFIEFNEKTRKGILKCKHTAIEDLKTAVLLLKEINKTKVIPRTLKVSGTLKKARVYLEK